MKRPLGIFILLTLLYGGTLLAQSDTASAATNRIALNFSNAFIPKAGQRANALFASIPKLGLTYERLFSSKFGISLMGDIELVDYTVDERGENETIRKNALSIVLLANFHFGESFVFFAGPGYEMEQNKDQVLGRIGFQYYFLPGGNWDISPMAWADLKEAHSAYVLGLSVGRSF